MAAADKQVKIVISGENQSDKAFKEAQGGLSGLKANVTQVAKGLAVFGAAGAAAVGAFAVSAIKSFGEAQVAMAKVNTTLKNTVGAMSDDEFEKFNNTVDEITGTVNTSAGVLEYLNKTIQESSAKVVQLGFDDEAAAVSIATLFQRTGDLTKATELNNLAMDLARAKSIDLEAASNLVGQVLSGNSRVLKQFGIEIDETLGPMEALGQLQEKVAGQSEEFAKTFPGQMLVLQETWSNLKDIVGEALVGALQPFIQQFSAWLAKPENVEKIQEIAKGFADFATTVIPILIDALQILYGWYKSIVDVLSEIIFKTMQAIDAIKSMIAAAKGIGKSVGGKVKDIFTGGSSSGSVNDAIISHGKIITTNPSDSIIATRNPGALGGGSGVVVNIFNPAFLDETMAAKVAEQITRVLKREIRY